MKRAARQEFEVGKKEKDPIVIARMLVVGRDAVQEVQRRFNGADDAIMQRIKKDVRR